MRSVIIFGNKIILFLKMPSDVEMKTVFASDEFSFNAYPHSNFKYFCLQD